MAKKPEDPYSKRLRAAVIAEQKRMAKKTGEIPLIAAERLFTKSKLDDSNILAFLITLAHMQSIRATCQHMNISRTSYSTYLKNQPDDGLEYLIQLITTYNSRNRTHVLQAYFSGAGRTTTKLSTRPKPEKRVRLRNSRNAAGSDKVPKE